MQKDGFLTRQLKSDTEGSKIIYLKNIDALDEDVRAALSNFLLKGYLDVKDESGEWVRLDVPNNIRIVASVSVESNADFSSAFYNRFNRVRIEPARYRPTITDNRIYAASMRQILLKMPDISGVRTRELREVASYAEDKIGDKEALDRILGALSRLTPRARKNLAELITLLMTGMHGDKLKTDIHMRALREHDGSLENRSLEKFFQLAWEAADKRASVTIPELVSMLMRFYGLPQKAAMRIRGIYEKIKRFDEQARWPSHKRYNFSIKEALLLGAYVRNAIITKKARGEEVDIYRIISEEAYTLYGEALEGESDGLGLSDKLYFNLYVLNLEQEHDNVIEADPVVTLDKDGFIADVAGVPVSPNKKKAVTPENVDSTYRLLYVPTIVRTMRAILRAWQPSQVPSGRSLPRAVSLMGQTGVAKTTLGVNLSYVLGLDHYVFPTHRQARETDLTMDIGIGGGEYYKDIKEFLNTVRRGNCVLVVDEANIRSKLLYGIISELAAGKKQFTVEFPGAEEEKVEVGENTFVMLTMNPQKEYGGRQKLPPVVMEDVVKIWVGGNYTEDEIALITRSFLGIYEKELSNLKINTDFLQAPTPGGRVMLTPSVLSPGQFALMRETEDRLYRKDGIGKQLKAALQSPVVQRRLKLVQDGIMALTHVELDRIGVSAKWSFAIYPDGSKEVTIGIKDLAKEVPPEEEMDHIKSMIGVIIHEIRHQKFSLLSRELAEAIDSGKVKFDEQAKENLKKALKSRAYHTFFNALEDGRIDSIKLDILAGENDYLKIWADREFRGQMTDKEIQTAEKLAEFQPHLAFENELFHYIYTKRFSEAFRQYPEELQKALHRSKKWALKATKKGWWGSMSVLPTSAEDREEVIVCQLRAMKIIAERILPEFDRFVKESVENIADKIRNKKMKISIVPPGGKKGKGEQGGEDQQGEGAPTAGEGAEGAGEGEGEGEGEGMGGEGEGIPIDFDLLPEDVKKELMEQMKNSVAGKMNPIGHEPESGDEVPGMPGEPGEGESVPGEAVPGEGVPGEGEPEGKPTSEEGQEGVFAAGEGEEGQEGEGKPAAAEGEETEEGEGTEGKPAGKTGEEGEEAREGEPEQGEGRQPVQPLMPEEGQMTPEEAAQEMKAQDKNAEESLGKRLNDIRENQPFVYNLSKVDPIVMMMSEGIKDALLEEGEDDFVYSASGRGDEVDFRRYLQGHPKPFRRRIESETIRKTSFEMCIDLSGSMDERNNPGLKEAVLAAAALFMSTMNPLEEELDEVEYGLSGFHGKFVPFKNFGQTLASGDLNGVMSALNSFYATGNVTDITHAVKQIIERLKDQEGLKIACMITDGEDNQYIRRGKGGKMEATGILADALREAEENGIIIVGIGIGEAARNCVEIFTHHAKIMSFDEIPELFIKIIEGQTLSDGLPVGDLIRQFGIRPDRSRRKEFMQRVEAQARKTATERHERTERDPGSVSHQEPEDEPFRSERTSLDDSYPEFLERRSENTEEQDPRVPVDVDNVLELLKNIIPAHLEDGRVYTIRYDTARLTSGQVEVIDEYVKCLKVRASNPRNIRVHPYSSRVGDKRSLIMVSCKGKGFFGEGRIDVKEEQAKELEKYILRIPLMLNIAIASSNIPDVESREELESYRRIIDYVQSQVKIITGGVLPLAGSHEEMLHALRNVTLTLPDADKVDHKYLIDRYNTQIREVLLAV
ncbi:MAG: AAA family ATPase [Candidatus Omnitrophota bacterium]|jgi:hypothetical protein